MIGGVLLDLSNLLLSETNEIFGWFPIYDTMRGVRGELKLSVSLLFFGKATGTGADSTDSVLFSYGPAAPPNMVITQISGFVEELLVDDDPEYDWKDQFRSSRTSNQTRQYVLYKLSAKLRREIGAKAIGLGCNAVIGFKKYIDYESEGSIVVRGFGTAVTLKKARPQGYFSTSSNFAVGSAGNASTIDLEEVAPSRISLAPISEASSTPGNAQSSAVASASASIATLPTATTTESEDEANALSLASQLPAATGSPSVFFDSSHAYSYMVSSRGTIVTCKVRQHTDIFTFHHCFAPSYVDRHSASKGQLWITLTVRTASFLSAENARRRHTTVDHQSVPSSHGRTDSRRGHYALSESFTQGLQRREE